MPAPPNSLDVNATSLFLDVDGTLLELRDDPSEVVADAELIDLLKACFAALGDALALVSGRSLAEIDRIFAPLVLPAAGSHGAEVRGVENGSLSAATAMLPERVLSAFDRFVSERRGLQVERKMDGVSLHYRKAPHLQGQCRRYVADALAELGDAYRIIDGNMVFEITRCCHNKGMAISNFLEAAPFERRIPVFIGDDATDEDGFRKVNELSGLSIRVGDSRCSSARYSLADTTSVRTWLRQVVIGMPNRETEKMHFEQS